MTDFRQNKYTKKWVIISPKRSKRLEKKDNQEPKCPFCYGSENMTPPETYRVGGGRDNGIGWKVRVVPNKFKITDIHEVIIHSPDHEKKLEDLPDEHIELILESYKNRYNQYKEKGRVYIFNNTGKKGAESLAHDHSQLTVVPFNVDVDTPKLMELENVAFEDDLFTVFCPQTSEWPYEVWFAPKQQNNFFGDISSEEIRSLSILLKNVINIIKDDCKDLSYNYYIYPDENWYLRLIPRISIRGGFEIATGIMVNIKDPINVAKTIKKNI